MAAPAARSPLARTICRLVVEGIPSSFTGVLVL
jgi:hypothetical protein